MLSKAFARILPERVFAAKKFPQIRLHAKAEGGVLSQNCCHLPFDFFDTSSLRFILKELDDGRIIEVRESNNNLAALGFLEKGLGEVQVFEWYSSSPSALPTIDEDFFVGRVEESFNRRFKASPKFTNTFRVVHGAEDGLPSLFVDQFSSRFYTVTAASYGANRLIPPVAEYLRRRGAEELIVETPVLPKQRVNIINPTVEIPSRCLENGVTFCWPHSSLRSSDLICTAYRRPRFLLREISKGKRVLCVHDCNGMAALNAVMTADKVVVASDDSCLITSSRANLSYNHGQGVFQKCEFLESSLSNLDGSVPFDIVFLEHHASLLADKEQWKQAVSQLWNRKLITRGSLIISCHEGSKETGFIGVQKLFSKTLKEGNLEHKLIRSFGASEDYPKSSRTKYISHFSHVHLAQ